MPASSRKLLHRFLNTHLVRWRPLLEKGETASSHNRARHNTVHLNAILNPLFRERFGESGNCSVGRGDCGEGRLRIKRGGSGHENHGALRLFQRIPSPNRQTAGTVQFQLHAGVPLLIRHLEEIDLRYGASDIQAARRFVQNAQV